MTFTEYLTEQSGVAKYIEKHGIESEKSKPTHSAHSIGFSEKEQKWHGWSHRAAYGFKVGDVVKKGDCHAETMDVGFKAKNLDDCRKMAVAFARSVS